MLIPSRTVRTTTAPPSLSRRVNANSQLGVDIEIIEFKLIKKGEC